FLILPPPSSTLFPYTTLFRSPRFLQGADHGSRPPPAATGGPLGQWSHRFRNRLDPSPGRGLHRHRPRTSVAAAIRLRPRRLAAQIGRASCRERRWVPLSAETV